MIDEAAAKAALRRVFPTAGDALERCESIIELQLAVLASEPPLDRLPDAVRLAASARLRAHEPIIPRDRVPIDPHRVAHYLRALARTLLESSGPYESVSEELVDMVLPPALADDAHGVGRAAEQLGLPADTASALLREALKPELVRTSHPFRTLMGDTPRSGRCPLCGDLPSAGTFDRTETCCRWCGLIWRWDPSSCASCGKTEMRQQEIRELARGAYFLQCLSCGEVVKLFRAPADPLVLSLLGVLTAPFDLAVRVGAGARPGGSFSVF
jgi:formate dehydrogenase maturation protein FdhE